MPLFFAQILHAPFTRHLWGKDDHFSNIGDFVAHQIDIFEPSVTFLCVSLTGNFPPKSKIFAIFVVTGFQPKRGGVSSVSFASFWKMHAFWAFCKWKWWTWEWTKNDCNCREKFIWRSHLCGSQSMHQVLRCKHKTMDLCATVTFLFLMPERWRRCKHDLSRTQNLCSGQQSPSKPLLWLCCIWFGWMEGVIQPTRWFSLPKWGCQKEGEGGHIHSWSRRSMLVLDPSFGNCAIPYFRFEWLSDKSCPSNARTPRSRLDVTFWEGGRIGLSQLCRTIDSVNYGIYSDAAGTAGGATACSTIPGFAALARESSQA